MKVYALTCMPRRGRVDDALGKNGGISTNWHSARTPLHALATLLRHPIAVLRTLAWTVQHGLRTPSLLAKCLVYFPRLIEIGAQLDRDDPDVVHLFWGHYPSVAAYYSKLVEQRDRVYTTSLGAYDLLYNFGPGTQFANLADAVWTHASANKPLLESQAVLSERIHVLRRGIDTSQVPTDTSAKVPGLIAVVARLVPEKGVESVIRAVHAINAAGPKCTLEVLGQGPQRGALEQLVRSLQMESTVLIRGSVSHDQVYHLLARADMLVLASTNPSERLPNVVKEALACRCVCIVSSSPGIDELLGSLAFPLVISPTSESIAVAISDVLQHPEKYGPDREAGREHILENFSADHVAAERIRVWNEALARRLPASA